MTFPDRDHPIWKIVQALISLAGLLVVVRHGLLHAHAGRLDATDAVGATLALKFAGEIFGFTPTKESLMPRLNLAAILAIIGQVAPKVLLFTPLAPIAGQVASAMLEAEQMVGASGADKLAHVKKIAATAADAANAEAGHMVIDPSLVEASATEAISTAKTVVNLVHDTHAKLVPATAADPPAASPTPGV